MAIEFTRDGPWDLPEGWVWARLGDIAAVNPKTSFDDLDDDLEIPFVPMAAMAEETGIVDYTERRPVKELKKGYTRFQSGDVLFAKITPCMENGKGAPILSMPSQFGAGSTEFHVVRSHVLDARYIWYWLVRRSFRGDAQRDMTGSAGQMRVSSDYLANCMIAVSPLSEQKRVVARIDELFTEIGDGEAELTNARTNLDTWRRALLKAAVTGELTREWREKNSGGGCGADLVADAEVLKAKLSEGAKRKRGVQSEDGADLDGFGELPQSWTTARLDDLTYASSYGTSVKCSDRDCGVAVLRIPNVRHGKVNLGNLKRATVELSLAVSDYLAPGDLLVVRTNGSADLIGRSAIIDEVFEENTYFASYLIRFRLVPDTILRRWVGMFFNSPVARKWILQNIASSAGQYNISQSALLQMPIPVPPRAEMTAVLNMLDHTTDDVNDVTLQADVGRNTVAAFRQSVLKAAFEGKLVVQNPRDEPADAMLARLNPPEQTPRKARARR